MTSLKQRLWRHKELSIALAVALTMGAFLGYAFSGPLGARPSEAVPAGFHSVPIKTGTVAARRASLPRLNAPPARTDAQRQDLQRRMALKHDGRKTPQPPTTHYNPAPNTPALNPAAPSPRVANGDFSTERLVGAGGAICPTSCGADSIMETSVAANGKYIFMTGNYFAGTSSDNGATWGYYDPNTMDGVGFCCDQQVIYEPARNVFLWEADYFTGYGSPDNRLDLWVLNGTTFAACVVQLPPTLFGLPSGTLMDYPEVEFGSDDTYLTWDAYNASGVFVAAYVARLDTNALRDCSPTIPLAYFSDAGVVSFALADGANEGMFISSNWYTSGTFTGTHVRMYVWTERNDILNTADKVIDPWNFLNEGAGNCASSDGVVTNWCARSDSRRGAAYRVRAGYKGKGSPMLAYAWNVAADASHGPYPYIVREYFNLADFTYQGHEDLWCADCALQYPSIAVAPTRGYVGGEVSYGGGTPDGVHHYPGNMVFYESIDHPGPSGTACFCLPGEANTTSAGNWGDYNTIRTLWPDGTHFVAGMWNVNASNVPTPYVIEFGLARDHDSYLRWSNS